MHIAIDLLKADRVGIRDLKTNLSKRLKTNRALIITDHSQPVKVVISYEDMLDLLDMLDELSDPKTVKNVTEGRKAIVSGAKGIPIAKSIARLRKLV